MNTETFPAADCGGSCGKLGRRPVPGVRFMAEPEANSVFIELPPATAAALEQRGWRFLRFIGGHGYRLLCSWATPPEAIDRFVADLRTALR